MAKWAGKIGYGTNQERLDEEGNRTGIYETIIVEKTYTGELLKNTRRFTNPNSINGDVEITNQIRILSDPYAMTNFHAMRYAEFMGTLWKISDATVDYPGILLTLGGVYNGNQS